MQNHVDAICSRSLAWQQNSHIDNKKAGLKAQLQSLVGRFLREPTHCPVKPGGLSAGMGFHTGDRATPLKGRLETPPSEALLLWVRSDCHLQFLNCWDQSSSGQPYGSTLSVSCHPVCETNNLFNIL